MGAVNWAAVAAVATTGGTFVAVLTWIAPLHTDGKPAARGAFRNPVENSVTHWRTGELTGSIYNMTDGQHLWAAAGKSGATQMTLVPCHIDPDRVQFKCPGLHLGQKNADQRRHFELTLYVTTAKADRALVSSACGGALVSTVPKGSTELDQITIRRR